MYVIFFAIWRTICSNAINLDNDLNYFCFEVPHLLEIKFPGFMYLAGGSCALSLINFIFSHTSSILLNYYSVTVCYQLTFLQRRNSNHGDFVFTL